MSPADVNGAEFGDEGALLDPTGRPIPRPRVSPPTGSELVEPTPVLVPRPSPARAPVTEPGRLPPERPGCTTSRDPGEGPRPQPGRRRGGGHANDRRRES